MRSSISTLSLSNSQTVICDYLYLLKDGALQDINDVITSSGGSSDFSSSNLTDNSITNLVLSNLCYYSISDPRFVFGSTNTLININNNTIITIEEDEIQLNENLTSVADITTIGNIATSTLGGVALTNYLTTSHLTDNSIGDIVLENICFSSVSDQRFMMTTNNSYINAPSNMYFKIGSTTVGTLTSSDLTLTNGLTASYLSTTGVITTSNTLFAGSAFVTGNLSVGSLTGYYTSTEVDTLVATSPYYSAGKVNSTGTQTATYGRIDFSVVRNSTGYYTITFNTPHTTSEYIINLCVNAGSDGSGRTINYAAANMNGFSVYIKGGASGTTSYDRTFMFAVYP